MEHWIWWRLKSTLTQPVMLKSNTVIFKTTELHKPQNIFYSNQLWKTPSLKANTVSPQNTARSSQRSVFCRLIDMKLTALPHLSPDRITAPTTQNLVRKKPKTPNNKNNPSTWLSTHFSNFAYFTFYENILLRILRIYRAIIHYRK